MNDLISVVIPVYQVELWLRECLDSVTQQTYRKLEIILIDDGSTDGGGAICDEYARKDSRITVIHQKNEGLGKTRNTGMDNARGKYIIFLDSDDYWQPETIETLYRTAEKDRLQLVIFSAENIFSDMEPIRCPSYAQTVQNGIVKNGPDSLRTAIENREYFPQACLKFYLLGYLRENRFRFDEGVIHEDESFSFLAHLEAERVECLGEKFYIRRHRPGSIMMTLDPVRSVEGYCTAMETIRKHMRRGEMSREKIDLCNQRLKRLSSGVMLRYHRARKSGDRAKAEEIRGRIDATFRKVWREEERLPIRSRIVFGSFQTGYAVWSLRRSVGHMKNSVKM